MIFVFIYESKQINILRYFQSKVRYFPNSGSKIPRNECASQNSCLNVQENNSSSQTIIEISLAVEKYENLICFDRLVIKCIPLMIYLLNPLDREFHPTHLGVLIKTVGNEFKIAFPASIFNEIQLQRDFERLFYLNSSCHFLFRALPGVQL